MIPASRLALTTALLWFLAANLVGLFLGLGALPFTWRPAHALPRFRGVVFRRPGLALFQVLLANLGLLGMALAWGLGLETPIWSLFATLSALAGTLFAPLVL